jgi:hypothetical protein
MIIASVSAPRAVVTAEPVVEEQEAVETPEEEGS